ncbi:hypothetical protein ACHAWF_001278, partial [Thalassiosira exigua]
RLVLPLLLASRPLPPSRRATAFLLPRPPPAPPRRGLGRVAAPSSRRPLAATASSSGGDDDGPSSDASSAPPSPPAAIATAPALNGKSVLPIKALLAGLKGHDDVAAVYAILDSDYERGSEGWERAKHVGITRDLGGDISRMTKERSKGEAAYVRALSFSYPQKAVMTDFAEGWREKVRAAGGALGWTEASGEVADAPEAGAAAGNELSQSPNVKVVGEDYEFDDEDEDMDEDDLDDYLAMMAESRAAVSGSAAPAAPPLFVDNTGLSDIASLSGKSDEAASAKEEVISPFDAAIDSASRAVAAHIPHDEPLELTLSNVDKVLDEVRPYLISDGGNVSAQKVDEATGDVYLKLEGACGSCASSTVTMKMGIERVLKENFGDRLGEVVQVEDEGEGGGGDPTMLTTEAVQAEVNRMSNAIVAMGGVVRVSNVDPASGVVEVEFRGPERVKKGLELALLDVEYVERVEFVPSTS